MKKQIIVINGGSTYDSYGDYLKHLKGVRLDFDRLTRTGWKDSFAQKLGKQFEVIQPKMPNPNNAKYSEWTIWFKKIKATILISAPFHSKGMSESLGDFGLSPSLSKFARQGGRILIYHSKDDMVVPVKHAEEYKNALPNVELRIFQSKGHFNQATFSELVKEIKGL